MAIVRKTIATLVDDVSGETATISVSYDDTALRITQFRVENPTSRAISATLIKQSNGRVFNTTFPAARTTFITIPASPAVDRVGVGLDSRGRLTGVEFSLSWVV